MGFWQRTMEGALWMKDRYTLTSRGSSKRLLCRPGGWLLIGAEARLMLLTVHEHQLEGRWALQAGKELQDILVMVLPYRFSLGFLLKAYSASARSGKGPADPRVYEDMRNSGLGWILQSWQTCLGFSGKA